MSSRPIAIEEPQSSYVEALRGLRTSLLLSRGGAPPQVVLVTSSVPGEGKSTLSINLAILLAQHDKKVLLVDADLRRPTLHQAFAISSGSGLSSHLAGQGGADIPIPFAEIDGVPGLRVLCAGPVPPYPSELLGSEQMRRSLEAWRQQFDFIVFDGAPVLPVTDSVVLGGLVDAKLLVARFKLTERQSLEHSYRLLRGNDDGNGKVGIVINAVNTEESSYLAYYGYSPSGSLQAIEGSRA